MVLKNSLIWIILILLLLLLFLINLSIGSVTIPVNEVFQILIFQTDQESVHSAIVWDFRMTKALTCILAGSALSLGGLQMQTLFRNPLAGPDVLGLTSGASLAVSLIFMSNAAGLHLFSIQTPWMVAIAASIGCAGVFIIMLAVSKVIAYCGVDGWSRHFFHCECITISEQSGRNAGLHPLDLWQPWWIKLDGA
jgi:iron complex transport system permease protein